MFGSRVEFSGTADMVTFEFQNLRWPLTAILDIENGHNFAIGFWGNRVCGRSQDCPKFFGYTFRNGYGFKFGRYINSHGPSQQKPNFGEKGAWA